MEKKYELVKEDKIEWAGRTLHRIRALKDFSDVKKGDFGGYIEMEENLSQEGSAWVYGSARVCDSAMVYGSARVYDSAWVYGSAMVYDSARVCGSAMVYGSAWVYGSAMVCGSAEVYGSARVCGSAEVYGSARVQENEDYMFFGSFGSEGRQPPCIALKQDVRSGVVASMAHWKNFEPESKRHTETTSMQRNILQ